MVVVDKKNRRWMLLDISLGVALLRCVESYDQGNIGKEINVSLTVLHEMYKKAGY